MAISLKPVLAEVDFHKSSIEAVNLFSFLFFKGGKF